MILHCSCFKGFLCTLFLKVTEQRACCEWPCLWCRDQNPNLALPILTTGYKAFFSLSFPLAEFIFEFCIVWQKAQGNMQRLSHPKGAGKLIVTISCAKECCRDIYMYVYTHTHLYMYILTRLGTCNPKVETSSPKRTTGYRLLWTLPWNASLLGMPKMPNVEMKFRHSNAHRFGAIRATLVCGPSLKYCY